MVSELRRVRQKPPLIAIVDDDEFMRDSVKRLIRALGFSAETFVSAEDFLASPRLDEAACLIADVKMPGMSGPNLHRQLVASGKDIPTILITGFPTDRLKKRALDDGVMCFLKKPFAEDDLVSCIQRALAKP
jgi:FixJ family two-component response regulator